MPIAVPLEQPFHEWEQRENNQCERRAGSRGCVGAESGGHPDRRIHPDRGGGCEATNAFAAAQDGARPQKPDPRHDLRGDTIGRSCRRAQLNRED